MATYARSAPERNHEWGGATYEHIGRVTLKATGEKELIVRRENTRREKQSDTGVFVPQCEHRQKKRHGKILRSDRCAISEREKKSGSVVFGYLSRNVAPSSSSTSSSVSCSFTRLTFSYYIFFFLSLSSRLPLFAIRFLPLASPLTICLSTRWYIFYNFRVTAIGVIK